LKKENIDVARQIADLFRTMTYSAVAQINKSVSRRLPVDKELREQIKRVEVKYSYFKA